jgi:methyl-accepting chemotaxis protein
MKNLLKLNLTGKLILQFLAVAVIPIVLFSLLVINLASGYLMEAKTAELTQIRDMKAMQVKENIRENVEVLNIISTSTDFRQGVEQLMHYHKSMGAGADVPFNTATEEYHAIREQILPYFSKVQSTLGYYDIFMICADHGHVMFSVLGEDDLGANLSQGALSNSGLAKVWEKVKESGKATMVDFAHYAPSNETAAFLGMPMFDHDQHLWAVLVMQQDLQNMENIIRSEIAGMERGEVFLVGPDLLSRSARAGKGATQLKIDTEATRAVTQGLSGSGMIINYKGTKVLTSYKNLHLDELDFIDADFDWGIVAQMEAGHVMAPIHRLRTRILWCSLAIVLLVVLLALYSSRGISRPIRTLSAFAEEIGNGNLSIEIKKSQRSDELGILQNVFATMAAKLKKQVDGITEGVNVLTAATAEITATLSQFTASSQETVTSVNETTATVEEVRQTIQVAMDRASEITENTEKTMKVSSEGEKSVLQTIEGMNVIDEQMSRVAESILRLSEQSQAIGNIVETITDLAEQSKLLAVNAAIEAARAGEEGKGFAVVAGEVKNLADQSKQATWKVKDILLDVQKATSSAVMSTEEGSKMVKEGLKMANHSGEAIKSLADVVEEIAQSTLQIGASTKEQFIGIDQVNEAMQNINAASIQDLESARQLEKASERLMELAGKLMEELKEYS